MRPSRDADRERALPASAGMPGTGGYRRPMAKPPLPPAEYYARLPHHLVGAGVVLRDGDGRVLLVQPTYRSDTWEIPGGALEHGEYPWEAAVREVREEIGLTLHPGRLLAVDVLPAQSDGQPPLVNFVFDGGVLNPAEATAVRPCDEELSAVAWSTRQEQTARLAPHMARRIDACMQAAETGQTAYLQYGYPPEDGHG